MVEDRGELLGGCLVEDDPEALPVWCRPRFTAGRSGDRVFELRRGGALVWVRFAWSLRRLVGIRDLCLERAHGPSVFRRALREDAPAVVVWLGQENLSVAL
jgi:hypothetical protein